MLNIKHILFPVDFSERCRSAALFVESMARCYGARITLLSVAQPFYYGVVADPGSGVVLNTEEILGDLKTQLDSSLAKEFARLSVERLARLGDAAEVIINFVHTQGVDLIMMPTHGYGLFRNLLLGSVTAKVLHDAKCPVWTAAHVAEPPCLAHITCHNILCAVDGKPDSIALMKWADELVDRTREMYIGFRPAVVSAY